MEDPLYVELWRVEINNTSYVLLSMNMMRTSNFEYEQRFHDIKISTNAYKYDSMQFIFLNTHCGSLLCISLAKKLIYDTQLRMFAIIVILCVYCRLPEVTARQLRILSRVNESLEYLFYSICQLISAILLCLYLSNQLQFFLNSHEFLQVTIG